MHTHALLLALLIGTPLAETGRGVEHAIVHIRVCPYFCKGTLISTRSSHTPHITKNATHNTRARFLTHARARKRSSTHTCTHESLCTQLNQRTRARMHARMRGATTHSHANTHNTRARTHNMQHTCNTHAPSPKPIYARTHSLLNQRMPTTQSAHARTNARTNARSTSARTQHATRNTCSLSPTHTRPLIHAFTRARARTHTHTHTGRELRADALVLGHPLHGQRRPPHQQQPG